MEHPPAYLQLCWACKYRLDIRDSTGMRMTRAIEYERVLEFIEDIEGPFSISGVWRATGMQPWRFGIVQNVVRDLKYHNLVRCVKMTGDRKCRAWETV